MRPVIRRPVGVPFVILTVAASLLGAGCSGGDGGQRLSSDASASSDGTSSSSTGVAAGRSPEGPIDGEGRTAPGAGSTASGSVTGTPTTAVGPSTVPTAPPVPSPGTAAGEAAIVCPGVSPLPAGVARQTRVTGDVDADGAPDTVMSYADDASPSAGDWHLRVTFGAGGGTDLRLAEDPSPGTVRVLGTSYLGPVEAPDGLRPVIFAWTGSGASARTVGLYRVDGCALVPLVVDAGQPAGFVVGASVGHQEGLRCETAGGTTVLVEVLSQPDASGGYEISRRSYRREGNQLVADGPAEVSTASRPPQESGRIVGCGDVPES